MGAMQLGAAWIGTVKLGNSKLHYVAIFFTNAGILLFRVYCYQLSGALKVVTIAK